MKASKIEWTRSTFNPWWGCEKVSPGCTNCYAEAFAKRVGQKVWGGDSPRRLFGDKHWAEPLRWNAEAAKTGEPWRVFCASMADVFEDRRDLDSQRHRLFALIQATPALTWLLLTKRPENMVGLAPARWNGRWPDNVWAGATAESPALYAERVPHLRRVPATVRFLSVEPQVEFIVQPDLHGISWVIQGGESGGRARPFDLRWAYAMKAACASAGVAYHLKQLGGNVVDSSDDLRGPRKVPTVDAKGGDWSEWPEDLRVREYPGGGA